MEDKFTDLALYGISAIFLIIILREGFIKYWKIDKHLENQEKIINLLEKQLEEKNKL